MKKHSWILAAVAFVAIAASCDDESPTDPNGQPATPALASEAAFEYMPLDKGYYWIYENYFVDDNGNKIEGNTLYPITYDSIWVDSIGIYEGKLAARMAHNDSEGAKQTFWWTVEGQEILVYQEEEIDEDKEAPELGIIGWWPYHSLTNGEEELWNHSDSLFIEDPEMGDFWMKTSFVVDLKSSDSDPYTLNGTTIKSRNSEFNMELYMEFMEMEFEAEEKNTIKFGEKVGILEMTPTGFDSLFESLETADEEEPEFESKSVLVRYKL
jgi:hypothetical protein